MITDILLFWIGLQLNAPTWFWWLLGVKFVIEFFGFGIKMFKAGSKN